MPVLTPQFDESDIRRYFDAGAWGRGLGYARYGHIIDGRVEGDTLFADCVGSQPYPYHVRATWRNGQLAARCTCPIGALGDCKHVVALLITWIEHPEDFVSVQALDDLLASATAEQLRSTLESVLARYPQTQQFVGQLLQGPENWSAEMVCREVERIMADAVDRCWSELWDTWQQALPGEVTSWVEHLGQCRADGHLESMLEITDGLISALEQFVDVLDDAVLFCLREVTETLIDLLAPYRPTDIREQATAKLANVALWKGSARKLVLSEMARDALVERLDKKERRRLAREIKRDLMHGPWHEMRPPFQRHEALFYYALIDADSLAPVTRLQHAQDLNDPIMAIDMMLELGYKEKQFQLLAYAEPNDFEAFLEPFERRGRLDEALDWMIERNIGSTGYHNWLERLLEQKGRWDALLRIIRRPYYAESLFVRRHEELRRVAKLAGRWDDERDMLVEHYAEHDLWHKIVTLHLEEKRWDDALEALERVTSEMVPDWLPDYRGRVAMLIAQHRPMAASLIYAENVEQFIGYRTRAYYRRAAELLVLMRECHEQAGQLERWEVYLADLLEDYASLPALADEMRQAGI